VAAHDISAGAAALKSWNYNVGPHGNLSRPGDATQPPVGHRRVSGADVLAWGELRRGSGCVPLL